MTKKDFELIAKIIATIDNRWQVNLTSQLVAEHFAIELAATNPRFDRTKFIAACK